MEQTAWLVLIAQAMTGLHLAAGAFVWRQVLRERARLRRDKETALAAMSEAYARVLAARGKLQKGEHDVLLER